MENKLFVNTVELIDLPEWLDTWESWAVILTALFTFLTLIVAYISARVAFRSYKEHLEKERVLSITDQIAFFREVIIPEFWKADDVIKSAIKDYKYIRIRLEQPYVEYIARNFAKDADQQRKAATAGLKEFNAQQNVLNALEELSIKILLNNTQNDRSLNSIKQVFVEFVEFFAVAIIYSKELTTGQHTYTNLLKIYDLWKDDPIIDKRSAEVRNQEFSQKLTKAKEDATRGR